MPDRTSEDRVDRCIGATGVGGGLHPTIPENDRGSPHPFSSVPDPGMAALHRDQLQASAIVAALNRAARDGDVSLELSLNRVSFEWPHSSDALFVFEAITGKKP